MKEAMHFKEYESNSFWLELDMSWFWIKYFEYDLFTVYKIN